MNTVGKVYASIKRIHDTHFFFRKENKSHDEERQDVDEKSTTTKASHSFCYT
jgi:hypothetical protein